MSTPFDYQPPPTSGRPGTSTGRRPGTANPFRQLVEQQQQQQQQAAASGSTLLPTLKPSTSAGFRDDVPRPTTSYTLDPSRNPYYGRGDEDDISEEGGRFGYGTEESNGTGGFGYTEDEHGRPFTSSGQQQQYQQPHLQQGYHQQQGQAYQGQPGYQGQAPPTAGGSEYEDEESDDEDVFAFLPPTTAEVEEDRRRREAEEAAAKRNLTVPGQQTYNPYGQQAYSYGSESQQYTYGAPAGRDEGGAVAAHLAMLGRRGAPSLFGPSAAQASTSTSPPTLDSQKIRTQDPSFAYGVPEDEEDVPSPTSYQSRRSHLKAEAYGTPGWQESYSPTSATGFFDPSLPSGSKPPAPPQYEYAPPASPPSTASNSNDGSRAGRDGMKMQRLDRKSSGLRVDDGKPEAEEEEDLGEGVRSRKSGEHDRRKSREQHRRSALTVDGDSVTVAASLDGKDVGSPTSFSGAFKAQMDATSPTNGKEKEKSREREVESKETPPMYGKHWQHFQPNPARHNPNSGPYKRHREYHYNQAYPQHATGSHTSTGYAGAAEAGPSSTGSAAIGVALGGGAGGARRRKRKSRQAGTPDARLDTAATNATARTSEYAGGSEYGGGGGGDSTRYRSRREDGEEGYGDARPDTGLTSLGYREKERERRGSVDEMYEDEEDYEFDEESREGSIKMEFDFDAIEDEDSPYPEVRASVSNIDDPDMPAMTIRMWCVGLVLCMASSALNVFFNFRSPAPSIVPLVLLLLSYPIGKFLAFTLPITTYRIPLPYLPSRMVPSSLPGPMLQVLRPLTFPHAIEFSLNPGPWNIKEHVLVYIMANVAVGSPYALNAIVVLEVFYGFKTGYWFALTLVLATQLTGFGLAGMCRRFLVWPASMVWPQNLVACTLLNTLHAEDEDDGIGMLGGPRLENDPNCEGGRRRKRGMSRYRFFLWTTIASFVFFFLPGYLFEALSIFSFVCWAAPNNVVVNQLFGVKSGLGMSMLTFDWAQITWIGSPLMVPWWAEVHVFVGFVLFYWIMTPILYYTNSWKLAHFPMSNNSPYDRYGNLYEIDRILNDNGAFDLEAYEAYSPLFLPATYAVTYLLAFCLSTCVIVHTLLYHGHTLLNGFKKIRVENDDIHAKLMRNYPEVPDWWYLCAFAVFFSLAIVTVEVWDTSVPVWALLLSVALPMIYILPSGFIYAMTGQGINLNILAQIIPGTLIPGDPRANMIFKSYSVQTLSEATNFIQDLKLGHYVKVPPRATFLVQMIATTLAAFVQVGVKHWIFTNVPDICNRDQPSQLTCPHNQVFFTASAIWGLIGPTRQFGAGSIYHPHIYAIVIGAILPVPFWLWRRRYPNSWVKWVSTPVILNGVSWIPPATGINYSSWFLVGFMFQYIVRKRNFAWWSKFNYVLSSALDSGTVIAVVVIFFTLQFPKDGIPLKWWGNEVFKNTTDFQRKPWLPAPEGGIQWEN